MSFDILKEQRRFHNWCNEKGLEYNHAKDDNGVVLFYYSFITHGLWEAWKAALKT